MALLGMILQSPTKYRQHDNPQYEGWASFNYQELERKFGRNKFKTINEKLDIFLVQQDFIGREEWSKVNSYTKAYQLTDKVTDLRAKFLASATRRITNLLTEDGNIQRTAPKQAIEAKRKQKNGKLVTRAGWHGDPVEACVPVNQDKLKKLALTLEAKLYANEYGFQPDLHHSNDIDLKYLRQLLEETQTVIQLSRNTVVPGCVIHRYAQTDSGRLYASHVNLQNAYRPVRQAALHGLYDYDIENCHYSILDQMAAKHGHTCTSIRHYLDNRKSVRDTLAKEFSIKPKQVKVALLALVYGAAFSEKPSSALPKILGSVETAIAFYNHPLFGALGDDIRAARHAILKGPHSQKVFRGNITNMRGLQMAVKGHADRQLLAHLLQGVESMALEAAHNLYASDIVLLQHDGFTAKSSQLNIKAIEEAIFQATSYRLAIAPPEQILVTLDAAFDDHQAVSIPNRNLLQANAHAGLRHSLVS